MRGRSALKNIVMSIAQNVVILICGFIIPKLIITTYGSNVNGLINSITQFLAYISLLDTGIGIVIKSKLYKPISKHDKHEIENILSATERFYNTLAKIFLVYIVVLCFVFPMMVSREFDALFTITLLIIISVSTLAEYFFGLTYATFLQADQKNYINSIFRIITTILNAVGVIVLILCGANIFLVKLISSVFFVLRPLLLKLYVKKKYNLNLKNADKDYKLENKWDGAIQHIAYVVHTNTDVALLTIFVNTIEVSVYSVYFMVISGIKSFADSLVSGIDATFGDMIAKNEQKQLNDSFNLYESIYLTLITIIFSCTLILIVPFVTIYTRDITDANYIRPTFAFIIVLAEFMHSLRLPYSSITYAAGHFKQTTKGAWVEVFLNIGISIIFIMKMGIIGVAIGTLVAMTVRTIEFNYYSSKHILKKNFLNSISKIVVSIIEVIGLFLIMKNLITLPTDNYLNWILYAIIVFIISTVTTLIINAITHKDYLKNIKSMFRTVIKR